MPNTKDKPAMSGVYSHGETEGYLRKDAFGRLFIDKCASDEEHLTAARVPEDQERPDCRKYLDDLVAPQDLLGKNVTLRYVFDLVAQQEN